MGVVVSGIEDLIVSLANKATRSSRGAREELQRGAIDIRDLARLYAPVDEGNLEDAIKEGKSRGSDGRNVYTVEVDESQDASTKDHPNRVVGDYAMKMHDGVYNLGPLSEAKAEETGLPVGRKFLERAMEDMEDSIKIRAEAKVNQGIGH